MMQRQRPRRVVVAGRLKTPEDFYNLFSSSRRLLIA
jgi:hypothetical protein